MIAQHGLVIGKFYPPHRGHHLVVRTAARTCRRVTVIVMAASVESIPLELRVRWLREVHSDMSNVTIAGVMDENPVDFEDPDIWSLHVALMHQALKEVTSEPVDAVFTSEAYGDELARRFNARHIRVDQMRTLVPVSGRRLRADPVEQWSYLEPPVRAWFTRRVVLIGAESTGKSTLALDLTRALRARGGAHFETRHVTEFGRDYAAAKWCVARAEAAIAGRPSPLVEDLRWETSDFVEIAKTQNEREDRAASEGGPILICDTDAFATSVWHERYLGKRSPDVDAMAASRSASLYLVTHSDDVGFIQDGTRDGESIREWMTHRIEERLLEARLPFVWIRGDRESRRRHALIAIDALLAQGWNLAPPIG